MKALHEILKETLRLKGWSRRGLAKLLEVSHDTVADWVKGARVPSLAYLTRIAELSGRPLSDFVPDLPSRRTELEQVVIDLATYHGLDNAAQILAAAIKPPAVDPRAGGVDEPKRRRKAPH